MFFTDIQRIMLHCITLNYCFNLIFSWIYLLLFCSDFKRFRKRFQLTDNWLEIVDCTFSAKCNCIKMMKLITISLSHAQVKIKKSTATADSPSTFEFPIFKRITNKICVSNQIVYNGRELNTVRLSSGPIFLLTDMVMTICMYSQHVFSEKFRGIFRLL